MAESITYRIHINGSDVNTTNANDINDDYDSEGAMKFIICTIVVYAVFGVFCTLVGTIKKNTKSKQIHGHQDDSISKYLKTEKTLKFEGYKMRLQYVCEQYSEKIREYEEKVDLQNLETTLHDQDLEIWARKSTKRNMNKKYTFVNNNEKEVNIFSTGVIEAVEKMGLALVYPVGNENNMGNTEMTTNDEETDEAVVEIDGVSVVADGVIVDGAVVNSDGSIDSGAIAKSDWSRADADGVINEATVDAYGALVDVVVNSVNETGAEFNGCNVGGYFDQVDIMYNHVQSGKQENSEDMRYLVLETIV